MGRETHVTAAADALFAHLMVMIRAHASIKLAVPRSNICTCSRKQVVSSAALSDVLPSLALADTRRNRTASMSFLDSGEVPAGDIGATAREDSDPG